MNLLMLKTEKLQFIFRLMLICEKGRLPNLSKISIHSGQSIIPDGRLLN